MFDMKQPLSIKKVRDYVDLKKDTQLAMCVGLMETRSNDTILGMCIDSFEFVRKYANENIKNTDLRDRILGANNSFYRMSDPFNWPDRIAQGLAGLLLLKELLEYEKERGNEE